MFCQFCGKQIADTARFCPGCGNAVSASQAVPVQAQVPVQPQAPASEEVIDLTGTVELSAP